MSAGDRRSPAPLRDLLKRVVADAADKRFEMFTHAAKSRKRRRGWCELRFDAAAASGPDARLGYTHVPNLALRLLRDANASRTAYRVSLHLLRTVSRRHPCGASPADRYVIATTGAWTIDAIADATNCDARTASRTIDALQRDDLIYVLARTRARVSPARRLICLLPLFRTDSDDLLRSITTEARELLDLRIEPSARADGRVMSADEPVRRPADGLVRTPILTRTESACRLAPRKGLPQESKKALAHADADRRGAGRRAPGTPDTAGTSRPLRARTPPGSEAERTERFEQRRAQALAALAGDDEKRKP